jgi:hypothetical protein
MECLLFLRWSSDRELDLSGYGIFAGASIGKLIKIRDARDLTRGRARGGRDRVVER